MSSSSYGRRIAQAVLSLTLIVAPPLSADTPAEEIAAAEAPRAYPAQAVQVSRPAGTRALRTAPRVPAWAPGKPIRYVPKRVYPKPAPGNPRNQPTWQVDPLLEIQERGRAAHQQSTPVRGQISGPNVNVTGLGFSGAFPPDTVGDVGPTAYVQAINALGGSSIKVYDKTGGVDFGPFSLSSIGAGACATGLGDPIVLYDRAADRWLLAEFSGVANALCVYISQTPDPGGAYYAYVFTTPNFPDYPKFAVWSDSYLITTNEGGPSPVYALDRSRMLIGQSATMQRFTVPDLAGFGFQALTPADLDGANLPPLGAPGYFMRHRDDEVHDSGSNDPNGDFLEIWELSVDHAVPGNSTLTGPTNIAITEIDSELCGLVSFNCFEQPNGQRLDPLREVVMWRLQYRNFGSHETLVGNLTTDVSGTDRGGIRWFELRNSGGGWTLFQEGTYSPDTDNRWMGSIAMDQAGNIALGYSVVSPTQFTDIRYTGREAGDPAGTMPQGEFTVAAGTASQNIERWGDYSAMSVDPSDDCTFWYTNEFVSAANRWDTQIASLKFDSCPASCGDGTVAGPEACDDGNTVDGDGCSSSCQIEPGFVCTGQPSFCAPDQELDSDNDLVVDSDDVCPATVIRESVPTSSRGLGRNRWTLDNPDGSFTQGPPQSGRTLSFTTADTRGCSCEQIIAELGLGEGHSRFGCSTSAITDWVNLQ